jgi:hypothetical protein
MTLLRLGVKTSTTAVSSLKPGGLTGFYCVIYI